MTSGTLSFGYSKGSPVTPAGLSKRNVLNIGLFGAITNDYPMLDHMNSSINGLAPSNYTGSTLWPSAIDSNGWPNVAIPGGAVANASFAVPDPVNFGSGPANSNNSYTMDWVGNGSILVSVFPIGVGNATFTTANAVNCTASGFVNGTNGNFTVTSTGGASKASIQIAWSTAWPGPTSIILRLTATGAGGHFIKNIRWYRTGEASELAAGNVWRNAWKEPIKELCPSAIRFMNVLGGNSSRLCRFENRGVPTQVGCLDAYNWLASPCYATKATGTNQYTVAAATPTAGNPKTTPTNQIHGEIATVFFTNGFARTSGGISVVGVSTANPAQVTTNSAHGYNTGDIITHYFTTGNLGNANITIGSPNVTSINSNTANGMFIMGPGIPTGTTILSGGGTSTVVMSHNATFSGNVPIGVQNQHNLHLFPCLITVTGSTTYTIQTTSAVNIDGSTLGTFVNTNTNGFPLRSCQYISLQVGSGGSGQWARTAYPVVFPDGNTPGSYFGAYLSANDTKTFYFDKTISGQTDGAGNPILGAWMFNADPGSNVSTYASGMPIEYCVALINELNAMSPAQVIGMWMNIPCWGLNSNDPDYSTSSDWAVNAVDVVMNPNSTVRTSGYNALGYSGTTQLNKPNLILEYSNELWPSGTNDGRSWLLNKTAFKWPTAGFSTNWQDLKALRSVNWSRDVTASNPPGLSRIFPVLGLWGTFSLSTPGDGAGNYPTVFGGNNTANPHVIGDWYSSDPLVVGGGWGRPIDNHAGVCPATYFDPNAYYDNFGVGSMPDDVAMWWGADNSGAISFNGAIGWAGTAHGDASTNTLTVDSVTSGTVSAGDIVNGSGFASNIQIVSQTSGVTGGAGVYATNKPAVQTTVGSACTATSNILTVTGAITNGPLVLGQVIQCPGMN